MALILSAQVKGVSIKKYIKSTFEKVNNYLKYVINQPNREVKPKHMEDIDIEYSMIHQAALKEQEKRYLLFYLMLKRPLKEKDLGSHE